MLVKELIKKLKEYPEDAQVVLWQKDVERYNDIDLEEIRFIKQDGYILDTVFIG